MVGDRNGTAQSRLRRVLRAVRLTSNSGSCIEAGARRLRPDLWATSAAFGWSPRRQVGSGVRKNTSFGRDRRGCWGCAPDGARHRAQLGEGGVPPGRRVRWGEPIRS
jgi:hypothetical protein